MPLSFDSSTSTDSFTGWEEKDDVVSFPFKSAGPGRMRFGGLEYIRVSDDEMRIELKLRRGDEVSTEVFSLKRVK